jgi:hypothetical protein
MARKKIKPAPEPRTVLETSKPEPEPPIAAPKPGTANDLPKIAAVILLALLVLVMAWYLFHSQATTFVPGSGVDAQTFKDIFANASRVYIVMDVRGVTDANISRNILQCGVDFAGSSGMGGKNVSYISLGDSGCVEDDGSHAADYCISQLKDGITIYVKEGASSSYYSNALVVGVGPQYAVGSCAIKSV